MRSIASLKQSIAQLFERVLDACADDNIPIRYPAPLEIACDQLLRAAVALDESGGRGAATQRLNAEGARSRVQIEHTRARDARCEDVEDRLAQPVGRRAQACPRRRAETTTFVRSGDHPHHGIE